LDRLKKVHNNELASVEDRLEKFRATNEELQACIEAMSKESSGEASAVASPKAPASPPLRPSVNLDDMSDILPSSMSKSFLSMDEEIVASVSESASPSRLVHPVPPAHDITYCRRATWEFVSWVLI
jgi:hypothetical protein